MNSIGFFIALLTALSNLTLGLLTYFKNKNNASNILLTILTVIIASWTLTNYFSLNAQTAEETLFWIRLVMFVTAPLGATIFLLIHTFPSKKILLSRAKIVLLLNYVGIVAFLALSPYMFESVSFSENGSIIANPGPAIGVYGVGFIFLNIAAFYLLVKKYRKATGLLKLQLRYILLGVVATFSCIMLIFLSVAIFKFSLVVSLGPVTTLILIGSFMYAIVRHRLMDVRLVIARALSYTLLTLIIISLYGGLLYSLGNLVFQTKMEISEYAVALVLAIILAYTFNPIRRFLEKITEKWFFQENYQPEELLARVSYTLSITLDLKTMMKQVSLLLQKTLSVEKVSFLLRGDSNTDLIVQTDAQKGEVIMFDELEESDYKDLLRQNNLGAIVKLQEQNTPIGFLVLGYKKTGSTFSDKDVSVLGALGPQLAIAIKNSQRYEEIERFSEKLKVEIAQATESLRVANQQLTNMDKTKNEFINMAAHELRAPLTAIKGFLSMVIGGDTGEVGDKTKEFLEDSAVSTQRMIRLVNNMLDVGRIEEGRMVYSTEQFNMTPAAKEIHSEFQVEAKRKNLELNFIAKEGLSDLIETDRDRLQEVVVNFVSNAVKYTETGKIDIELTNPKENIIRLEVRDTGPGISALAQKKLFQKFYRVEEKVGKTTGTGLGLYISKLLIEKFGGSIGVTSEENKGSIFWFELPVVKTTSAKQK